MSSTPGLPPLTSSEPGGQRGTAEAARTSELFGGLGPQGQAAVLQSVSGLGGNAFPLAFLPGRSSEGEPPAGTVTLNSALYSEANEIYASGTQPAGGNIETWWGTMTKGSFVRFSDVSNSENWILFELTADAKHVSTSGPKGEENFYLLEVKTIGSHGVMPTEPGRTIVTYIGL